MRVDIKRSIDVSKLMAAIVDYTNMTNYRKDDSYLVMSSATRCALMTKCNDGHVSKEIGSEGTFDEFYGIPIAICNKLDFGEVDVK